MKNKFILVAMLCLPVGSQVLAQSCIGTESGTPVSQFVDNEDGTVTDTKTGLMWKRCPEGYVLNQSGTPADMTDDVCVVSTTPYYNWPAALSRANGAVYAGYDDWRVPNIKELLSAIDYQCYNPAQNTAVFPEPQVMFDYWSSTPDSAYSGDAWDVDMKSGRESTSDQLFTTLNFVLLVRGGL